MIRGPYAGMTDSPRDGLDRGVENREGLPARPEGPDGRRDRRWTAPPDECNARAGVRMLSRMRGDDARMPGVGARGRRRGHAGEENDDARREHGTRGREGGPLARPALTRRPGAPLALGPWPTRQSRVPP
ncbi:hypothetical protein Pta02_74230 [Planobispora takensis]|uniref:Uncharacterized protein n=1 Tax=Planobispora takensis TaxID=1367882 RepID=A0A8J3T731_9ACTN|nr:hypothetical protein Pta02_74230 [Planobispora takensis]